MRLLAIWTTVMAVAAGAGTAGNGAPEPPLPVRLVPAPRDVRDGCRNAARAMRITVFCPGRAPRGWRPAHLCGPCRGRAKLIVTGWFPAPESYVGQPYEPTGHLNFWAAKKRLARLGQAGCAGWGRRAGTTRVRGMRAAWIVCPQGSSLDGGHVVLQWWIRNWTYGVSLHSNTLVNRGLLRAIAARLDPVRR